ncbi:thioredoxin family protein [Egicoccus sp. AB-alg2]|uniref:thioredoxin family protein n=1 Tax=Egicoccus sp. AB-alg2 TaxID=3242693 RepID=UPI00359EECEB
MALTSNMLALGTPAPAFALPEVTDGTTVSLDDLDGEVLVVAFLSRHCPYVKHVQDELAALARDYVVDGRASFVGICANDADNYPDDAPERLADQKRQVGFVFPYLHDADQEVAKAYRAACTPDFFVFDRDRRLAYRGRMDESRPGGETPTGKDLRAAIDALLAGERPGEDQAPSMGCGIKWRPGNEPA